MNDEENIIGIKPRLKSIGHDTEDIRKNM